MKKNFKHIIKVDERFEERCEDWAKTEAGKVVQDDERAAVCPRQSLMGHIRHMLLDNPIADFIRPQEVQVSRRNLMLLLIIVAALLTRCATLPDFLNSNRQIFNVKVDNASRNPVRVEFSAKEEGVLTPRQSVRFNVYCTVDDYGDDYGRCSFFAVDVVTGQAAGCNDCYVRKGSNNDFLVYNDSRGDLRVRRGSGTFQSSSLQSSSTGFSNVSDGEFWFEVNGTRYLDLGIQ